MNRRRSSLTAVRSLAFLLLWLAGAGAFGATPPSVPLLLISMDGFRWDYASLHPEQTPNLRQLAREGISAEKLIPVFPTNTFPNHYSIVTGLYPSRHGIVNNEFFDPIAGEFFRYNVTSSSQKKIWWGGEPIWVTAQRQGLNAACSFWPGSEAEIAGMRPKFWKPYSTTLPFETRLDELFAWLRLPLEERPAVITIYLEEGNSVGHKFGPGSPELIEVIETLDARLGAVRTRLEHEGVVANMVVVSDHGMTPVSAERVVLLDDYIAPSAVQLDFDGSVVGLRPADGDVPGLLRRLEVVPRAKVYATADLPARFRIEENPRNPPVWIIPEEGWEIYFRARFETFRTRFSRGDHGYDNAFPSMQGILVAQGPAFRSGGTVVPAVENVHLYNALCAVLRIRPAANDGDDRLVKALLR